MKPEWVVQYWDYSQDKACAVRAISHEHALIMQVKLIKKGHQNVQIKHKSNVRGTVINK